jgi:hypothetical protein
MAAQQLSVEHVMGTQPFSDEAARRFEEYTAMQFRTFWAAVLVLAIALVVLAWMLLGQT